MDLLVWTCSIKDLTHTQVAYCIFGLLSLLPPWNFCLTQLAYFAASLQRHYTPFSNWNWHRSLGHSRENVWYHPSFSPLCSPSIWYLVTGNLKVALIHYIVLAINYKIYIKTHFNFVLRIKSPKICSTWKIVLVLWEKIHIKLTCKL